MRRSYGWASIPRKYRADLELVPVRAGGRIWRRGVTKPGAARHRANSRACPMDRRAAAVPVDTLATTVSKGDGGTAQWTDPSDRRNPSPRRSSLARSGRANHTTTRAGPAAQTTLDPLDVSTWGPPAQAQSGWLPPLTGQARSSRADGSGRHAANARRPRVGRCDRPRPHRLHRLLDLRAGDEPALAAGARIADPDGKPESPSRRSPQPPSPARRSRRPSRPRPVRRSSWPWATGRR